MKNEILDLTKKLISIESISSKKEKLQEVINVVKKELEGFTIEEFSSNEKPSILVYSTKKQPKKFKVILNGHLDVVAGKAEQFVPYEKGGKLYGRGAIDMKSGAAVEIVLFKKIARLLPYPVGLQLVTDEEVGGYNGTQYQIKQGVRADFVVAAEPTGYGINNKAKGIIWMNVKTKGVAGHGAYQWRGKSAILKMKKALDAIEKKYPVLTKEKWRTSINIAKIETSNMTFNKVPDDCDMRLDVRYIPEDWKSIKKTLTDMFRGMELTFQTFEPPQFTDENNTYVKVLKQSVKTVTHKLPKIIAKHGGSDIRHYNGVHVNGVTCGPVGEGLHADNEWVLIESLNTYYAILELFFTTLITGEKKH